MKSELNVYLWIAMRRMRTQSDGRSVPDRLTGAELSSHAVMVETEYH